MARPTIFTLKLLMINMKKLILILLLSIPIMALSQSGATKGTSPKNSPILNVEGLVTGSKVSYQKIAVLNLKEQDVKNYFDVLNEYKRLLLYEPNLTSDQKIQSYKNIDNFINEMVKQVKIDSVKIEPKK